MQKEDIKETLIDFGLSKHEALVYLSSLTLGPSTVNKIAKDSGVKRTTVYPVIDALKRKGIINIEIKGLKKLFVAENPEKLGNIIEQKKDRLKSMIPELTALYSLKTGESLIRYYEGVSGIKTVYDHILDGLKPGDEYLIISDIEKFLKIDSEYFTKHIEKRAKMDLKVRTILQNTADAMYHKSIERNNNWKIKILEKNVDLKANIVILPNKLVITQIVDPLITIVIENKSMVDMQRDQFNIIWDTIK
jgi:sugar-specific transcriptional regulator TrmB